MKVIIIGGGQVGSYVANILVQSGCEVKIIEHREQILNKLRNEFDQTCLVEGNGTDPKILESAGIAGADVVASVTGTDEVNLVVSTIAKYEFGVDRVIARVNHPRNSWLYSLEMGVDVKVNQAELMARLIVNEIDFKNVLTLMKLSSGDYSIVQVSVSETSKSVNQNIKDLDIPDEIVLIAINRDHEVILPKGDTVIHGNDIILAFANDEAQRRINKLFE